jgi:hypothetical protein
LDEFARWYFSGMKPYSGLKRSMIAAGKTSMSIVDALKNSEVSKTIHENLSTTSHKITLALNDPAEAHFIDIAFHLLGP